MHFNGTPPVTAINIRPQMLLTADVPDRESYQLGTLDLSKIHSRTLGETRRRAHERRVCACNRDTISVMSARAGNSPGRRAPCGGRRRRAHNRSRPLVHTGIILCVCAVGPSLIRRRLLARTKTASASGQTRPIRRPVTCGTAAACTAITVHYVIWTTVMFVSCGPSQVSLTGPARGVWGGAAAAACNGASPGVAAVRGDKVGALSRARKGEPGCAGCLTGRAV